MKSRCYNPRNRFYARYGGRGIFVCDRWRDSFQNFLDDMGEKPSSSHSIERLDNDAPYEPGNCVWATDRQQANNTSRNRWLTHNGQTMTVAQWARKAGIPVLRFWNRINTGWSIEDAMQAPRQRAPKSITHDGETLPIAEWSQRMGIPPHAILVRIKRGWSEAKAITTPMQQGSGTKPTRMLTDGGVTKSLKEWADAIGVAPAVICKRIKRGWDVHKSVTTTNQGKAGRCN